MTDEHAARASQAQLNMALETSKPMLGGIFFSFPPTGTAKRLHYKESSSQVMAGKEEQQATKVKDLPKMTQIHCSGQ